MEFSFRTISVAGLQYKIREHKAADLGLQIWPGAPLLLGWLASIRDWNGVSVLELGAGTGLLAVGLAKLGACVYATDFDRDTLSNLQFNVDRNSVGDRVQVLRWDWNEDLPEQVRDCVADGNLEYCVGSDVAYFGTSVALCSALSKLKALAPELEVYLTLQERGGDSVKLFVDGCAEAGLQVCIKSPPAVADGHGNERDSAPVDCASAFDDLENCDDEAAFDPGTLLSPGTMSFARVVVASATVGSEP